MKSILAISLVFGLSSITLGQSSQEYGNCKGKTLAITNLEQDSRDMLQQVHLAASMMGMDVQEIQNINTGNRVNAGMLGPMHDQKTIWIPTDYKDSDVQ